MYKVEYERIFFDDMNRVVYQESFYTYLDKLEDALENCVIRMNVPKAIGNCQKYVYIWHDGDMIYHAECNEGVWS